MKQPKKVVTITLSPRQRKEKREADAKKKLMASVSDDQIWRHEDGQEYTTILLTNEHATKPDYLVTVCYYAQGKYWSQTLERFVQDKVFVRKYEEKMTPAEDELGGWLSGALEDPSSCKEFKQAVENWFNELPIPVLTKEIK
jgi:hypothetical protein